MAGRTKSLFWVLALGLFLSGCYTSFRHPALDSQGQRINKTEIANARSCYECHDDGSLHSGSVMPAAVQNDYSWHFYNNTAWWQDEYDFYPVNSVESAETTGPRLPGIAPNYSNDAITPIPVVPTTSGLSKKTAKENAQPEQSDNRRDFERRQNTKAPDEKSGGNTGDSARER